jgi:hypothetical protein
MTPSNDRISLADAPDEAGRTTATLVASLAARLATLYAVSGAAAVGSMVSGFAAIGREFGATAEGTKLRRSLERGRVAANGDAIWSALRIRQWASLVPAAPLLDQLRNDMALLLAPNLDETLALLPIPGEPATGQAGEDEPATEFIDCILGMYAFSREMTSAIDALAAPTRGEESPILRDDDAAPPNGSLLR